MISIDIAMDFGFTGELLGRIWTLDFRKGFYWAPTILEQLHTAAHFKLK